MAIAGLGATVIAGAVDQVAARRPVAKRFAVLAAILVTAAAARDAVHFLRHVDVPGLKVKPFDPQAAQRAQGRLPDGLAFLRWSRGVSWYDADNLTELVRFLRGADGDFLLIGDASVLYGLTGKRSVSPTLWLDPGLTMPRPDSAAFTAFEGRLLARLPEFDVRRIVVEGSRTWAGLSLEDFPRLKQLTADGACGARQFGDVRVLELCSGLETITRAKGAARE
jgi:hypothetical protein